MILQSDTAEDWVIATGKTTTIRDFVVMAFNEVGIGIKFIGEGVEECGYLETVNEDVLSNHISKEKIEALKSNLWVPNKSLKEITPIIEVDTRYFRPTEVDLLVGDANKAKTKLGWEPEYDLQALVKEMVASDVHLMKKELLLKEAGFETKSYYE